MHVASDASASMQAAPRRVQLSRAKGWRKPANTVVVSRPSKWGSPWEIVAQGHCRTCSCGDVRYTVQHDVRGSSLGTFGWKDERIAGTGARYWAVQGYRMHLSDPDVALFNQLDELRGKNLACWCPLDQPCHADVLLELANR